MVLQPQRLSAVIC